MSSYRFYNGSVEIGSERNVNSFGFQNEWLFPSNSSLIGLSEIVGVIASELIYLPRLLGGWKIAIQSSLPGFSALDETTWPEASKEVFKRDLQKNLGIRGAVGLNSDALWLV